MRRMLSMRDLKAQDLQGLSPEAVTALAAQMLERIEQQARELEVKQKLIERKDRDIAWRDAKLEKVTFELAPEALEVRCQERGDGCRAAPDVPGHAPGGRGRPRGATRRAASRP